MPSTAAPRPAGVRRTLPALVAGAALAFGAIALSGSVPSAGATTSSGERPVYTPITPCRLADTRPGTQVGPRATPIGSEEVLTVAARGANGQCAAADLPDDARALALNVTAIDATLPTFLTFWPSGERPNASSLNPVPGQPPTPNAVTVPVADDGSFRVFNRQGSVQIIIDVVGFYTDHDHDDRYDTSAEVDTKIATEITAETDRLIEGLFGTNGSIKVNTRDIQENKNWIEQERRISINRHEFHPSDSKGEREIGASGGAYIPTGATNNSLVAPIVIPTNSTVTGVQARVLDRVGGTSLRIQLYEIAPNGVRQIVASTMETSGSSNSVQTLTGTAAFGNSLVTDQFATFEVEVTAFGLSTWEDQAADLQIISFHVDYEFEVEQIN